MREGPCWAAQRAGCPRARGVQQGSTQDSSARARTRAPPRPGVRALAPPRALVGARGHDETSRTHFASRRRSDRPRRLSLGLHRAALTLGAKVSPGQGCAAALSDTAGPRAGRRLPIVAHLRASGWGEPKVRVRRTMARLQQPRGAAILDRRCAQTAWVGP